MPDTRPYKLTYPDTAREAGQETGVVIKHLTDVQAARMQRYVEHPHADLISIDLVEDGGE